MSEFVSNYDILHKSMWNSYDKVKKDNFKMEGLSPDKKIEILEWYLLPYFIKYEYFEVAKELQDQIDRIQRKKIMAERTIYSVKEPRRVLTDFYNKELYVGTKVAFNKSGSVNIGRIVDIKQFEYKKPHWEDDAGAGWWKLRCKVLIREIISGDISTVKNPDGIAKI